MVLESIISPISAEKKPWKMFFIGLLYSLVAVFISVQIFNEMAGLISVFLIVMASIPLIYRTIIMEEKKDMHPVGEATLLKEHSKALSFFIMLFLGVFAGYTLTYIFLPAETINSIFSIQINTIKNINSNIVIGSASQNYTLFTKIFFNNVRVLIFCILFAFFYGAGAIFILTWNASVIAVATGTFFRNNISAITSLVGFDKIAGYFSVASMSLLRYMVHGVPEITAYFIAGLAGSIISVAVIRHDFSSSNFERILVDTVDLILISIAVLFFAATLEVFVTPLLF